MSDDMERNSFGIYLPPTAENQGLVMQQRLEAATQEEIAQMTTWAESWVRGGQKPLQEIDIQQACMAKAQVYGWPPQFMIAVFRGVRHNLGLDVQPKENRQQQRARERLERKAHLAASHLRPVTDPNGEHAGQEPSPRTP